MKIKNIIFKILLLWIILIFYIILHEGGHLLMAFLFGGEITYFNINLINARMSYNGNFTMFQYSIIDLAGFGLPFLIWYVFISLIPLKVNNLIIKNIKVYSGVVISTIIPWIIIPILQIFSKAPSGDDVTKFLIRSNLNNLLVSLIFLCLFLVSFYHWYKKSRHIIKMVLLDNISCEINEKSFKALIFISIFFLILMSFPWINNDTRTQIGNEYQLLCQTPNLKELDKGEWELCKFWIEEKKLQKIKIIIVAENISAKTFNLKLEGPNDTIIPFINSKKYTSETIKIDKILNLKSGEYIFLMKVDDIKGKLYIYLNKYENGVSI